MGEGGCEFLWPEAERADLALISNLSGGIDQVDPIRPSCIGTLCRVAKFIENSGKFQAQASNASSGDGSPLLCSFGTGKDNVVANVALHLPHIAGMSFRDINRQKCDPVSILLVQPVEGGYLPPEWRSSVTAEYQYYGLLLVEDRELNRSGLIHLF